MFGEYVIYCNNKLVALVCDDMLFIKPTISGKSLIGQVDEQPLYPGAKSYYFISGELWEDSEWLSELIKITQDELPAPKPKKLSAEKAKHAQDLYNEKTRTIKTDL